MSSFLGTELKNLPKFLEGYRKLLVTIVHTDSYVINSENFKNINEQLKNGCVLVQGYDAYGTQNPNSEHYEAFPFNYSGKTVLYSTCVVCIRNCHGVALGKGMCNEYILQCFRSEQTEMGQP